MLNFLNTKQTSELLNLSPLTITRLIREGKINAFKIGREWVVTQESIEEYQAKKSASVNA